ncbi:MAG: RidA family protein [Methyloligellaceae bacterium]
MSQTIDERLKAMGLELPSPAAPAANYVPYVLSNGQLFISGQLPLIEGGEAFEGTVGTDVDVETAKRAARACAINILAQAKAALGELERIERCLKVGGFVNSAPDFTAHPEVINGASDLLGEILGERGAHARFAVGCASLPRNVPVEVDALFAVT